MEVFPFDHARVTLSLSFLHVCGGVSKALTPLKRKRKFSPRMWRCFQLDAVTESATQSFLHVCGGVSPNAFWSGERTEFSPRMWRCFDKAVLDIVEGVVFSTYVEVFPSMIWRQWCLLSFLHVCGGVS